MLVQVGGIGVHNQLTSDAAVPGENPEAIHWAVDDRKFRNGRSVVVV